MLNNALGALVKHTKNVNKTKINGDKNNFLHFQFIECTSFKIIFFHLYV
jgi:hypothetical protein